MQISSRSFTFSSLLALSAGLTGVSAHAAKDDAATLEVLNGEKVPECGFAPVSYLGNCTGTLVHPEIVLHAQHCGKPRRITLTHGGGGGRSLDVEYCKTYPGRWNTAEDFAFCKLKTPVTDIPPIPVAFGCEMDEIKKGADIVHCGFGANGGSGSGSSGGGIKRWGANTVGGLNKKGKFTTITTSPSKVVSCAGDSGGPLLMRMKDKTWRVIGVASTINGGGCSGSRSYNSYSLAGPGVAWVEKESGVDITPCFEPDGTWKPTKDCGKFYMGDQKGHGTWKDGCKGTPISGYSATCGKPFGDGEDSGGEEEESSTSGEESTTGDSSGTDDSGETGDSGDTGDSRGDDTDESPEPGESDSGESDSGENDSESGESDSEDDSDSGESDSDDESDSDSGDSEDSGENGDDDDSGESDDPEQEEEPTKVKKKGCSVQVDTDPLSWTWALGLLLGLRFRRRKSRT